MRSYLYVIDSALRPGPVRTRRRALDYPYSLTLPAMDIDIDEGPLTQGKPHSRTLLIDDNHPFDLDSYISSYSGGPQP